MGWLKTTTGSFTVGLAALGGLMIVASLLTLFLRLLVKQE